MIEWMWTKKGLEGVNLRGLFVFVIPLTKCVASLASANYGADAERGR